MSHNLHRALLHLNTPLPSQKRALVSSRLRLGGCRLAIIKFLDSKIFFCAFTVL